MAKKRPTPKKKKNQFRIPKHKIKTTPTKEDLIETEDGLRTKSVARVDYKKNPQQMMEALQELDVDSELYVQFLIMNEESQVAGRPRVYDPETHIPAVISIMAQGASKEELCLEMGVLPSYLWRWEKKYPAFAKAMQIGLALSEAWWRRKGRLNIHNKDFNNTLFMMNMQNRFNWSRRVDKNTRQTTETIEKRVMELDINTTKDLSDDELREIANILGGSTRQLKEAEKAD